VSRSIKIGSTVTNSATVNPRDEGERLDIFLAALAGISRSRAQSLITGGLVTVGGRPAKKNHVLAASEEVTWQIPPEKPSEIKPQEIPVEVVHEDDSLVVVDKPAHMVMYPGLGHSEDTLLNALLARYPDIAGVGGEGRPGIFHRLDRDTSGLVAVARTETAYQRMVEKVQRREVERVYIALVTGDIPASHGTIDAPMGRSTADRKRMAVRPSGGREAVTAFRVMERFEQGYTLVEVKLETGRTHQIRVHFAYIGHPVTGDPEYSRGRAARELGLDRQFLHAHRLSFEHPVTGRKLDLCSELPDELAAVLDGLRAKGVGPALHE
jgi:23S rRNA pseudouridine1911/1915/1917 synthase